MPSKRSAKEIIEENMSSIPLEDWDAYAMEAKEKGKEGAKTSEFKVVVAMAIAAVVNPLLERFIGASIPSDVFISLVGLAGGYIGSRTFLKR